METLIGYGFGLFFLTISAYFGRRTWVYVEQYRTLSAAAATAAPTLAPETITTVSGPVSVEVPVEAEHECAGIVAWRIRERRRKGSGRVSWSTTDGGIDVGTIAIETDDGRVGIDADVVRALVGEAGTVDPWDVPALHLSGPDRIDRLDGDPDLPVDVSMGSVVTANRTQFETTTVENGDQLLVRGRVLETADGPLITRDDDEPFIVSNGPLDRAIADIRVRIAMSALFSAVLFAFALAAIGGLFETITIG